MEKILRNGFSIIELLMVLAITGLLAAMSYPNYHNYITRAHRTEGKTALLDLACRMEHYYSKHQTYQTATIGTGNKTDVLGESLSETRLYTLSIARATDETYLLTATTRTLTQDAQCPLLTLNHSGAKGPRGGIVSCW